MYYLQIDQLWDKSSKNKFILAERFVYTQGDYLESFIIDLLQNILHLKDELGNDVHMIQCTLNKIVLLSSFKVESSW